MQRTMAVGWFPEAEWVVAIERWPTLVDDLPRPHAEYLAAIEARLADVAGRVPGARLLTVPITVDALDERAAATGGDAGSAELRGALASARVLDGLGSAWPPGRNGPCWCGSGQKYKHCHGTPRTAAAATATTGPDGPASPVAQTTSDERGDSAEH